MKTARSTNDAVVLNVIRTIQLRKRAARRHPDHALLIGDKVFDHVAQVLTREGFNRVLDRLVADKIIRRGPTATDTYVRVEE